MKIFLFFFWKAIKIAGSAQKNNNNNNNKKKKKKNRVGRVSGNTGIFFRPYGIDVKSSNSASKDAF